MYALNQPSKSYLHSPTLPLVETVFELFPNINLIDAFVIGAQHILPTTLQMLASLILRGLSPSHIFLIGKCYSTDLYTFENMQNIGIQVCPSSLWFNKKVPFDEFYETNIAHFFTLAKKQMEKSNVKRIIILDDGGKLIRHIRQAFKDWPVEIVGVEQTTSGYEEIKKLKLDFPVINVARSAAKLKYESPMIAETLAQQLGSKLIQLGLLGRKMLIVGNGSIGKAIFEIVKNDFEVDFFDIKPVKSDIKKRSLRKMLCKYDVIVGCTGKKFLSYADVKYLKEGVILISASSSDREFSAHEFRKRCSRELDCHDDFEVNGIKILNAGFPVNFGSDASITDPPFFQLTRALLVAAILNVCTRDYPNRLIGLDKKLQNFIVHNFTKNKADFNTLVSLNYYLSSALHRS